MFIRKKKLVSQLVASLELHKALYEEAIDEAVTNSDLDIDAGYYSGVIDGLVFAISSIDEKALPATNAPFIYPEDVQLFDYVPRFEFEWVDEEEEYHPHPVASH